MQAEKKYYEQKPIKWVIVFVFFVLGMLLGYEIPKHLYVLLYAKYQRGGLDTVMQKNLGHYKFEEILTQELLIPAYAYNTQEPRFFSRYFSHNEPGIYDVTIASACEASSAAPTFFAPMQLKNGYGFTEQFLDGGVICNNPSLYAYEMARDLYDMKKIRVLSLGTGQKPFTKVHPASFSPATKLEMSGEFMMNMDAFTADYYLKTNIPDAAKNYHRAQMDSSLSMDDVSDTAILNLLSAGDYLWE